MILMKAKLSRLAQFVALIAGIWFCISLSFDARKCPIDEGGKSYVYKEDNEFGICYRLYLSHESRPDDDPGFFEYLDCLQISKLCRTEHDFYAIVDTRCIHMNLDTERSQVLSEEPSGLVWQLPEDFWKTRKR